jgi:general secretion pathway protein H
MGARVAQAMLQTSRTWSTERSSGFTLIEMMAVMLIIALMASLVVSITTGTGRSQLHAVALRTAALFRRERQGAILTGHNRLVSLDFAKRSFVGDSGEVVTIPRDVVVDVLGADQQWEGQRAVARFEPDGASSGAVVRLSREGARYEIRVNWFTGGVAVETQ